MDVYSVLFWDAFKAMFVFSMSVETAWFAALEFGRHNLFLVTLACYLGGVAGAFFTAATGYIFGYFRKYMDLDEDLFQELSGNFNKYGIYIFLFQMIPFSKLFLLFAGVFAVKWRKLVLVLLAGRAIYYLFYLAFPWFV